MERVRKGKSINEEQEKLMIKNKVPNWYINSCKKIKYMFPKAHATAYVKMAWRIAWFKIYYPLEYYATYFTTRADFYDIDILTGGSDLLASTLKDFNSRLFLRSGENKLSSKEKGLVPIIEIAHEMYARGFAIENISLEESMSYDWKINVEKKSLIPPFSIIDGIGETVCLSIVNARNEKRFLSIEDLSRRTLLNQTNLKKMDELKITNHLGKTNQMSLNLFNV
jgi:DNA polymerase-3 subunit alpha (Gram-positive type)